MDEVGAGTDVGLMMIGLPVGMTPKIGDVAMVEAVFL